MTLDYQVTSVKQSSTRAKGHSPCIQWRRNEFESGGTGPERKWGSCPSTFFGSKSTISRFGERFRDDQ